LQREPQRRILDQRGDDDRIEHDVEGVEHPAERRRDERAMGAVVGLGPPRGQRALTTDGDRAIAGGSGRDAHENPIAFTEPPARSKPARIFAARSSEPGVSPWTQIVSASRSTIDPSVATTVRSVTMRTARATTASGSWMTEPALRRDASDPSGS